MRVYLGSGLIFVPTLANFVCRCVYFNCSLNGQKHLVTQMGTIISLYQGIGHYRMQTYGHQFLARISYEGWYKDATVLVLVGTDSKIKVKTHIAFP